MTGMAGRWLARWQLYSIPCQINSPCLFVSRASQNDLGFDAFGVLLGVANNEGIAVCLGCTVECQN